MSIQTTSRHPVTGLPRAGRRLAPRSQSVVALILEDGTIRQVGNGTRSRRSEGTHGWSNGSISGTGWTLWWERRKLA
ncbi:MAG TPA: hypothetical protein VGL18_13065 [Actinomycetota bacterium]|jgi:hypothetical protein